MNITEAVRAGGPSSISDSLARHRRDEEPRNNKHLYKPAFAPQGGIQVTQQSTGPQAEQHAGAEAATRRTVELEDLHRLGI